jgi:RNA polymerase sigma factor (sigma-70 family)
MPGRMSERSDEELLAKTPTNADAFACFYRRYEVAMLAFFKRRVHDTETAADLTAEVFASALASAPRFRPADGPAAAWLFGIAHHKLVSSWRRGSVEDRARRRLGMAPIALTDDDLDRVDSLVEDLDVGELLAGLPTDQRAAVQARILDERSYADIARELRCSSSVVRKRVSRGLARLRATVEEGSP